jgi:hypothetical protein
MELIREELRPEGTRDGEVIKAIWSEIEAYEASQ